MQPRLIINATEFSSLRTIKARPQQPNIHVRWSTVTVLLYVGQISEVTDEARICKYYQNGNKSILKIDLTMSFVVCINLLKPSGFFTYHQGLTFKNSTWCSLCIECFVRISEHTATCALYIFNRLVFITVVQSVYSAVRTDCLLKQITLCL
jgi:hypothetical protein